MLVGLLVVLGLVYLVGYHYLIKPQKSEAENLHNQVSMFENQVARNADDNKEEATGDSEAIAQLIPNRLAIDSLLREIHGLANSSNVQIDYIGSATGNGEGADETTEETSEVQEATYSLDVTGESLKDVNQFLDAMLEGERLITIETLNVDEDGESFFASISFSTYYAE